MPSLKFNQRKTVRKNIATFIFSFFLTAPLMPLSFAADINPPNKTRVEYGGGWYVRVDIGFAAEDIKTDEYGNLGRAAPVSLGMGKPVSASQRLEFTTNHFSNLDDPNGNIVLVANATTGVLEPMTFDETPQVTSLMANLYQDFHTGSRFQPYVGVGIGAAGFSSYDSELEFSFSGNGMAGLAKKIGKDMWLDFGYRYTFIDSVNLSRIAGESGALSVHEARIGLRYEIW